ncbi:hypothetical protein PVK06_035770 [Gossypium arboreum]|uniref:Bet v I/Major latex protein domain-containing protein n=1 Tax=Gossypium arboreum TaxID=29729 RepID=A0ABR0NIM6_GOSAR|nr:hypothetical protein PVK06_035770 [Gossypium arboreum]
MGVVSYNYESTSPVAPARLFKAFVLEADKVWPIAAPHAIKSIEVEANPGPGSIVKINFVEGGPLGDKLEKINYENKFEAAVGGGTVCKSSMKFYTVGDYVITEDEIKALIKGSEGVYKAIEAYLLANPDASN